MEDNYFGYWVSLILGLWLVLKFKKIGTSVIKDNFIIKRLPPIFSSKWNVKSAQISFLLTGILFVIVSVINLLKPLF